MTKEFNNIEEIKRYYDSETNTYIFEEKGKLLDIRFNFNLDIKANIESYDIIANNIVAGNIIATKITAFEITANDISADDITATYIYANNIYAKDIKAYNIDADDILYYAVCYAYQNIACNSINGMRKNAKHFVLDGQLIIKRQVKE